MNKYKQNCGMCMMCRGVAKQPKCPTCGSIKAKQKPYGEYGTIYVECDKGHEYDMAEQIDYNDIDTHQKVIDKEMEAKND